MPAKPRVPAYRKKICRGRAYAVVTLADAQTGRRRDTWLGLYDTPESRERYGRVLAIWEARGRKHTDAPPPPAELTLTQLCAEYLAHQPGDAKTISAIRQIVRDLRVMFGDLPAEQFGPNALREVRQRMIQGDPHADPPRPAWSHGTIVSAIHRIGAIFKWAAAHELLPITVYQQLKSLEPLKRGLARPKRSVRPADPASVAIVQRHVSRPVAAMIELQLATGMRSGELTAMRPADLDMTAPVWLYRPAAHKSDHRGHSRCVYLGPKAQEIVKPFLDRPASAYLFSPAEAEAGRRAELTKRRRTPTSCGNTVGSNRLAAPQRKPGERYHTDTYLRAIRRGIEVALRAGVDVVRWHPHQLRHNAATNIRRTHGLEAAQILLGHSSALVTEAVYAERDERKAIEVAAAIG